MNVEERSAKVKIGKKEYELVVTTRATKEIAKRYGGLANLGEKLSKSENFEEALSEIIWLVTTLANQSILIYNYENPNSKKPLLTEELVEIYTAPSDLAIYKDAITEALLKGTKREVESTTSKNV